MKIFLIRRDALPAPGLIFQLAIENGRESTMEFLVEFCFTRCS